MSNSLQGAVNFEVGGVPMHLRLTTNAMVRYQDAANETFLNSLAKMQKDPSDIRRIRLMAWAAMSHVDGMTEERAGDIMDDVGILKMAALIGQAVAAAFPKVEPGNG